jgi:gas vesicle protein
VAEPTVGARRGNSMLTAVLAGLTGAALALLIAPRSGRETRDKLKSEATELKNRANEGLHKTKGQIDNKLSQVKDVKTRLGEALSNTADTAKTEIDETREETLNKSTNQKEEE